MHQPSVGHTVSEVSYPEAAVAVQTLVHPLNSSCSMCSSSIGVRVTLADRVLML
jgi:hypothetical protein